MAAPIPATISRELDAVEQVVLDVLVARFNEEIAGILPHIEPGKTFNVKVDDGVEVENHGSVLATKIVMNAVAAAFQSQGWSVEKPLTGYGTGVVQMNFVRPLRETPLVPKIEPVPAVTFKE